MNRRDIGPIINLPGPPPFGMFEVQESRALDVPSGVELTLVPRSDERTRGTRAIRVHMKPKVARLLAKNLLEAAQKAESRS